MQLVESASNPLSAQSDKLLSGLFAEMGTYNQNGRRYSEEVYEPAYEELLPKINERRLLGELDHPIDYDEVRLSNVSHAIIECHVVEEDGIKKVYGTVELLDTPAGMIAQALVRAGIPIGISSRGLGNTRQVRDGVEVTQLKLITYDLVAEPSFSNAILSPDKSTELSDSLQYIESKLPLNESVENDSIRGMINHIRESLIMEKTDLHDEIDINEAEIKSLRGLLESAHATIKSDTASMKQSRDQIKELRAQLRELNEDYAYLQKNMQKLQDAYNTLKESTTSTDEVESLKEELARVRKELAVEKRGMSYKKVSKILEGASTSEDIENRLDSLSSASRKHSQLIIESATPTESISNERRLTGLASIVARV